MGRGPRGKAKRHRPPTGRPSDFRRPAPCLDSKRNGIGDPAWQRRTIMAKRESTQHKLDRVRAPRVQLTYDVEIGDAIRSEEHTSELQSLMRISYADFCLKKKTQTHTTTNTTPNVQPDHPHH